MPMLRTAVKLWSCKRGFFSDRQVGDVAHHKWYFRSSLNMMNVGSSLVDSKDAELECAHTLRFQEEISTNHTFNNLKQGRIL